MEEKTTQEVRVHSSLNARRAFFVGLSGNAFAVAAASLVFREAPGSAIRPMDIPVYIFLIAFLTAFCGIPLAAISLFTERKILLPLLSALSCAAPLFTGFYAFRYFVAAFQYTLKP